MDEILANKILTEEVSYPGYILEVTRDRRGEMYLQGRYIEADIFSGKQEMQMTRRWLVSPHMSKSELVQTALKLVLTSAEHRVREHFKYRGALIFGPHYNIDDLHELATSRPLDKRP